MAAGRGGGRSLPVWFLQPRACTLPCDRTVNSRKRISLARALSKLGHASRSRARPLIEGGHVTVNGEKIRDPEARIDIERDHVVVDGVAIQQEKYVYLVMYKPAGVVTTASDER